MGRGEIFQKHIIKETERDLENFPRAGTRRLPTIDNMTLCIQTTPDLVRLIIIVEHVVVSFMTPAEKSSENTRNKHTWITIINIFTADFTNTTLPSLTRESAITESSILSHIQETIISVLMVEIIIKTRSTVSGEARLSHSMMIMN